MWAQPITIAYQESDLSRFTTAVPTSSAAFTSTNMPMTPTSTNPSATSQVESGKPGTFSTGAIAGVAIGAFALLSILLGLAILFWKKKKKNSQSNNGGHSSSQPTTWNQGMVHAQPEHYPTYAEPHPKYGHWHEHVPKYGELEGHRQERYELSTT